MGQLKFGIVYAKNGGLIFSPTELIENYLHGLPICTRDGHKPSPEVITEKIRIAQIQVEQWLAVKLTRQVIRETRDFIRSEYFQWGYMKVTYPVRQVTDLTGFISTTRQVEFPGSWVSSKVTDQEDLFYRTIHIVPAGGETTHTNSVVFVGITPNAGFFGVPSIPNYFAIEYCTGFKILPANIRDAVGKLAAIQLLAILGDVLLGAGITSQSLSLDGLSQSIGSTKSASSSAYSARIKQYMDELKEPLASMKDWYKGFNYMAM